jgi:hypothetical protein
MSHAQDPHSGTAQLGRAGAAGTGKRRGLSQASSPRTAMRGA